MRLSELEREVLTDSMLKIQSIQASLNHIDDAKVAAIEDIRSCLRTANSSFRAALDTPLEKKTKL